MLDLIVELAPASFDAVGTRAEKIAARKAAFAAQSEPLIAKIRELGGDVTEQAWLNGTMHATLPKAAVRSLSEADEVSRLDLPHALKPDA